MAVSISAGVVALLIAAAGHLDPRVQMLDGTVQPYRTVNDIEFVQGDRVLPGLAWCKVPMAFLSIAMFALALRQSYTGEQEEQRIQMSAELVEQEQFHSKEMAAEYRLQRERDKYQAHLEAFKGTEQALAERRAMELYAQQRGIPVEVLEQRIALAQAQAQEAQEAEVQQLAASESDESDEVPPQAMRSPEDPKLKKLQTRLLDGLQQLNLTADCLDWQNGPSFVRFVLNPRDPAKVEQYEKQGKPLQLMMGLDEPPIISQGKGGLIQLDVEKPYRDKILFSDFINLEETPTGRPKVAIGVSIERKLVEVPLNAKGMEAFLIGGFPRLGGKTNLFRQMIASVLRWNTPTETKVQLALIDGKGELRTHFKECPYLVRPIPVHDDEARDLLEWAHNEIKQRHRTFERNKVADLEEYNQLHGAKPMPYVFLGMDEFQEPFNFVAGVLEDKEGEPTDYGLLASIASLGPSAGFFIALATQKIDRTLLPGQVNGKVTGRICLKVLTPGDSEKVIQQPGGERLLKQGDMLVRLGSRAGVERLQSLKTDMADIRSVTHPKRAVALDATPRDRAGENPDPSPAAEVLALQAQLSANVQRLRMEGLGDLEIICKLWNCEPDTPQFEEALTQFKELMGDYIGPE